MIRLIVAFWNVMAGYRRQFMLAGIALVIATALQLVFPWLLRLAIDGLAEGTATYSFILRLAAWLTVTAVGES
ncbi:hypothetical protein JXA80_02705, partial [bacterium]|nr:hypothetical protein [candidate division CSSED10-310 bacterium]